MERPGAGPAPCGCSVSTAAWLAVVECWEAQLFRLPHLDPMAPHTSAPFLNTVILVAKILR